MGSTATLGLYYPDSGDRAASFPTAQRANMEALEALLLDIRDSAETEQTTLETTIVAGDLRDPHGDGMGVFHSTFYSGSGLTVTRENWWPVAGRATRVLVMRRGAPLRFMLSFLAVVTNSDPSQPPEVWAASCNGTTQQSLVWSEWTKLATDADISQATTFHGRGRPDVPSTTGGLITGNEPIGLTYTSTDGAGVGATSWVNTMDHGWVVTHGDTGWRDVTHLVTNFDADRVHIRRRNDKVQVRLMNVTRGSGSGSLLIDNLPSGWTRDDANTIVDFATDLVGTTRSAMAFTTSVHISSATTTQAGYWATFEYEASRQWPMDQFGSDPNMPVWAAPRTLPFSPHLSLYNGTSPTAGLITDLIREGQAGDRVRMVCAGPSTVAGTGGTEPIVANASWPAQITQLLGARPGRVSASDFDNRWELSGAIAGRGLNALGLSSSGDFSVKYTSQETATGFTLYMYRAAWANITVQIDSGPAQQYQLLGGSSFKAITIDGLSDQRHTVTITGPSGVFIDSIESHSIGLTVHNSGRPSSAASHWVPSGTSSAWSQLFGTAFASEPGNDEIPAPDIALVQPMLNGSTPADMRTVISSVVALGIPTMLVTTGGVGSMDGSSVVPEQLTAMYDAADEFNLPLIDLTHAIGWYAQANAAGYMSDTVHPNSAGYAAQARTIHRVLATT